MSKEKDLDNFKWENENVYFGEEVIDDNPLFENPPKEEEEEKKTSEDNDDDDSPEEKKKASTEKKKEGEEEEQEKLTFSFEKTPEQLAEEEEEKKKADEKETATQLNSKTTLEFLKEKGLVSFELEEGEELTEDKAEEILEDSYEKAVEEGVEEMIKELPDSVKQLIKYASKGGNVETLLSEMAKGASAEINSTTDMSVEANQIKAVELDLKEQGYDKDYIDAQIEFLKSSGKLEKISKVASEKIVSKQTEAQKQEADRIAAVAKAKKESARKLKGDLATKVNSNIEVKGMTISAKADKDLPTYITEANVELQDGRVISDFQADLFRVMADPDKTLLLAKLIKSDFDFSSIVNKKITKEARELKKDLENSKELNLKSKGSSQNQSRKTLADLLDD